MIEIQPGQRWVARHKNTKMHVLEVVFIDDENYVALKVIEGGRVKRTWMKAGTLKSAFGLRRKVDCEYWVVHGHNDQESKAEIIPEWARDFLVSVEDGYGYYGVLLCDPMTGQVQCHLCGLWFEHLGMHVRASHGYSADDYRSAFDLGAIGLASIDYWKYCHDRAIEMDLRSMIKSESPAPSEVEMSLRGHLMVIKKAKSEERRNRLSTAAKNRFLDDDQITQQRKLLDDIRPLSYATTAGRPIPQWRRENISKKLTGRLISDESKENMRMAFAKRVSKPRELREQQIYAVIQDNPRASLSTFGRWMNLSSGGVAAHIKRMTTENKIERTENGLIICQNGIEIKP